MTIKSIDDQFAIPEVPVDDPQEQTFADYAATMPETAQGFVDQPVLSNIPADEPGLGDLPADDDFAAPSPKEQRTKRIKMSKKMQKSMDKLKSKAGKLPVQWFNNKAKERPEWKLDADEEELISDAIETVFDVLDIEIQIEPLSMTLTSIWWVLSYPICAFLFLFLSKKSSAIQAEEREKGTSIVD